jgi:death-on-curing protein
MNGDPVFLTLAEALEIHKNQIECYGGQEGIRDISLLTSALAVPMSTFHGQYLHNDLFEMAAAYAYHICQNHPFIDGNKRTALVTALVFLDFNGIRVDDPEGILYEAVMNVASGKKGKDYLKEVFKRLRTKE